MQEKSYANTSHKNIPLGNFASGQHFLMLLINFIPCIQILSILLILILPSMLLIWRIGLALIILYLLPPLICRVLQLFRPIQQGKIALVTSDFITWWILLSLQVTYCRLPFLEEFLRLFPGLYSFWLRLWGAHIGRLTYWSAGTMILDRPFLDIGNDVVFGAGVRLNPHVLARNNEGKLELLLGTIKIGDRAVIGGYSLLTAGTEIANNENTRTYLISPPFNKWKSGHRIKPSA